MILSTLRSSYSAVCFVSIMLLWRPFSTGAFVSHVRRCVPRPQDSRAAYYYFPAMRMQSTIASSDGLDGGGSSNGSAPLRRGDLEALTVAKLKDLLRAAALPVSGRKAELVDRLMAPRVSSMTAESGGGGAAGATRRSGGAGNRGGGGSGGSGSGGGSGRPALREAIPREETPRRRPLVPAAAGFAVPWDGGDGGDGGGEGEGESGVGAAEVTRELGENTVRLVSWNVNGLRALLKRPAPLVRLLAEERPHVLCLQETKLQESHVEAAAAGLAALAAPLGLSYEAHWHCSGEGGSSGRKGYSGVAVLVDRAATASDDECCRCSVQCLIESAECTCATSSACEIKSS